MSSRIAFIVEGAERERQVIRNMVKCFFSDYPKECFVLIACKNIYMIWEKINRDNGFTNIIELMREENDKNKNTLKGMSREDFESVYLFFDLDFQQNNLPGNPKLMDRLKIVSDMMNTFCNETEHGLLYISYPMLEAVRDQQRGPCLPTTFCRYPVEELVDYKKNSSRIQNHIGHFGGYNISDWKQIIRFFLYRVFCLLKVSPPTNCTNYKHKKVTPAIIYDEVKKIIIHENKIFVLSAFPEFLLDYFNDSYWENMNGK